MKRITIGQKKPLDAAALRSRAFSVIRPGVEAALVSAVALGVAQAGWTALSPQTAGASGVVPQPEGPAGPVRAVRSPFSPVTMDASAGSHAAAAMLASVQLVGVRMAADPAFSGAVLTIESGEQRAFVVGQEVAAGVRLSEVQADHILLSYPGGQQQIALPAAQRPSYALALMGRGPAPETAPAPQMISAPRPDAAPTPASVADGEETPFAVAAAQAQTPSLAAAPAPTLAVAEDAATSAQTAWLTSTLAQVEPRDGQPYGWRVASPAPQMAIEAGLREGDIIVSVNGAGPSRAIEALSAAAAGSFTIEIERADGARDSLSIAAPQRS